MMNKKILTLLIVLASIFSAAVLNADDFDNVIKRWTKGREYHDQEERLSTLDIRATYYSAEYIEAVIQKEAKKNLWTQQETDEYKYNYLKALRIDEMIPINIKFDNQGPTMYLGPFDIFVKLRIGNKLYKPVDYDKRFNFKFQGEKEGLVYFPRYDSKTGKDLLEGVKNVTLEMPGTISPVIDGKTIRFLWDIYDDKPEELFKGKSASMFETDRLLKRLDNLKKDKAGLEGQLKVINDEISQIQKRIDELQKAK